MTDRALLYLSWQNLGKVLVLETEPNRSLPMFLTENPRKGKITLSDFIGKEYPPAGWKAMLQEIFTLGFPETPMKARQADTTPQVARAYEYLWPGFHGGPYVHIASLDLDPLMDLYSSVTEFSEDIRWSGRFVRPTHGYVNDDWTRVVPAAADSSTVYKGLSHAMNMETCPYEVALLNENVYEEVGREAFLHAIRGQTGWASASA